MQNPSVTASQASKGQMDDRTFAEMIFAFPIPESGLDKSKLDKYILWIR